MFEPSSAGREKSGAGLPIRAEGRVRRIAGQAFPEHQGKARKNHNGQKGKAKPPPCWFRRHFFVFSNCASRFLARASRLNT